MQAYSSPYATVTPVIDGTGGLTAAYADYAVNPTLVSASAVITINAADVPGGVINSLSYTHGLLCLCLLFWRACVLDLLLQGFALAVGVVRDGLACLFVELLRDRHLRFNLFHDLVGIKDRLDAGALIACSGAGVAR